MKKTITFIFIQFIIMATFAQSKPAYILYNSKGKKVKYKRMIKKLAKSDVVLFGESHNNPISHWLELQVTKDLYAKKGKRLILGAEMIEQDNQDVLNQYLAGEIDQKALDSLARLWPNHKTDYKPLVDFAKDNKLKFIAANVPRRYAKMVFKGGFEALDSLPAKEKAWIAPLPPAYDPEVPSYKAMLTMMEMHMGPNFPKAQAIKDATMAHFIMENLSKRALFLHYNGSYHSDDHEGIGWYLKHHRPDLKVMTITTVSQKDISKVLEENLGSADYIICVPEDMTTTY